MIHYDLSVPGWTNISKLTLFGTLSQWASETSAHPMILEIGSWAGRSLVAWAANCPNGTVVSVDSSRGYTLTELKERNLKVFQWMKGDPDAWNMWTSLIEDTRKATTAIYPNVEHRLQTSDEFFAENNGARTFDIIFVDGNHDEPYVYRDVTNGFRVLRPGGLVMGDDYTWDGVKAAVDRYAAENNMSVWIHPQIDDLWVLVPPKEHTIEWWFQL